MIDEVIRSLKSDKEATVDLVGSGAHTRCAKVYRDMRQRSFQKRAPYQEGRKVRGSRQARTMAKPYGHFSDTLIMELVTDAAGDPAPRLGGVDLPAETAREYHHFLIRQIVRMLSIGLIHGDLSEFNVLVGIEGPVIINLPQAVNAAANNGAFAMLERDVNNIRGTLGRFAPELLQTEFAREMWAQFEQGELTADSRLTGIFARDAAPANADAVLLAVENAREEALRRESGECALTRESEEGMGLLSRAPQRGDSSASEGTRAAMRRSSTASQKRSRSPSL